ncbi:transposase [Tunturibacter empetritectus]|uniref:Transposase n=1 Tax=Tunturiibacter empetritectus TaxID=3069691 RepID=A0AAU7ZDJ6_9BACT
MAIPPRTSRPGTYFITSATHNRRRLFQVDRHAQLFLDTIQHYRAKGHYKLHAFVIMPDHIHLLLTPQTISLERAVGLIKGGFSHRLSSSQPIWQRSFTEPTSTKIPCAPTLYLAQKFTPGLRRPASPPTKPTKKPCQAPKSPNPAPIQQNRVAY